MNRYALSCLMKFWLLAVGVVLAAPEASALSRRSVLVLPVTVDLPGGKTKSLGTMASFLQRLRRAGRVCEFDPYEHGVNLACGEPNAPPHVILDFDFEPSRSPELARVDSLRANGINGGELPAGEWARFLDQYARRPAPAPPHKPAEPSALPAR